MRQHSEHIQKAMKEFGSGLALLYLAAGSPTYRVLAAEIGSSPASLSRAFGGLHLPSWSLTERLLNAFAVNAADTRAWKRRWLETSALVESEKYHRADKQAGIAGGVASAATECPRCGALVSNTSLHERWHSGESVLGQRPSGPDLGSAARRRTTSGPPEQRSPPRRRGSAVRPSDR